MKRIASVTAVLAALVLCSVALASTPLSGAFNGNVGGSALGGKLKGLWTLTFSAPNYTVAFAGTVVVHGTYTLSASKVTFSDKSGKDACPGKGVYTYKLQATTLTFKRVSDTNAKCAGRRAVLAATFTKKFSSSPGSYALVSPAR